MISSRQKIGPIALEWPFTSLKRGILTAAKSKALLNLKSPFPCTKSAHLFIPIVWMCCAVWWGCDRPAATVEARDASSARDHDSTSLFKSDSLYLVGERLRLEHQHARAISAHRTALSLREAFGADSTKLFYSHWRLALLLSMEQQAEAANHEFERAQALLNIHHVPVDTVVYLYLSAAANRRELRDFTTSRSFVYQARQMVLNQQPIDTLLLARCYNSLASVYYQDGDYTGAIDTYERMALLLRGAKHQALLARCYFNIGLTYDQMGQPDKAVRYLDLSQSIRSRVYGPLSDEVAAIYINKGEIYRKLGLLDSARYCFMRTLNIRQTIHGEKSMFTAGARESIAKYHESIGQLDSALHYHQLSLISLVKSFNEPAINRNPTPAINESTKVLVDFLVNKARVLMRRHEQQSSDYQSLALAWRTFALADSIFLVYQRSLPYDDPQYANLDEQTVPFDEMMEVAFSLHHQIGDDSQLEKMIYVMERSRASVLKDALTRAELLNSNSVHQAFGAEERQLLKHRAMLVNELSTASDERTKDSLSGVIVSLDKTYQDLQQQIRSSHPNYSLIRFENKMLGIDQMRELMRKKNGVWIQYFWGKDWLYAISVGHEKVIPYRLRIDSSLVQSLELVKQHLRQPSDSIVTRSYFTAFCKAANFLYLSLIAPLIPGEDTERLILSTHGPLSTLSFDVLLTELPGVDDEIDYRLSYLINRFVISHHYSSAQMERQFASQRHGSRLLALGYAGMSPGGRSRNEAGELPGTEDEIAAIRDVMNDNQNQFLLGEDASEALLKSEVERYNLLHLAVHGVADTAANLGSHLIFRSAGDSIEDGTLYAHELYGLRASELDLVVLSACESGLGKNQHGEGTMSMARGFLYAGCPSLTMSLWRIDDKTSAQLMALFYEGLSEGKGIDVALAEAKRAYLKEVNMFNSHPTYWAAFILVGETKPLGGEGPGSIILISMALLIVIAVSLYQVWKKKRKT